MGGPMRVAIPWNMSNSPNELVNISKPRRSTNTTEVKDTYTPETKQSNEQTLEPMVGNDATRTRLNDVKIKIFFIVNTPFCEIQFLV